MKQKKNKVRCRRAETLQVLDPEDLIMRGLPCDYQDTYELIAPGPAALSAMDLLRAMWSGPPKAVAALMALRDKLVKPFGLKSGTIRPEDTWLDSAQRQCRKTSSGSSEEAVLYIDDHHLAFLVSIMVLQNDQAPTRILATTAVWFHNRWGWLYFQAIRPLHGPIVSLTLKRLISRMLDEQEEKSCA